VTMANTGPLPQADLLALYRRLMTATRALERAGPAAAAAARRWQHAPVNRTRFAPRPHRLTLHLGHVANAIVVWGSPRRRARTVLFRHSRTTTGSAAGRRYDAALVEDLAWLGFVPDEGPIRQREDPAPYEGAVERLRADGRIYACACSRAPFDAWEREQGDAWSGQGCPGAVATSRSTADAAGRPRWVAPSGGWTCSSGRAPTTSPGG
jgi:hypothetical protein